MWLTFVDHDYEKNDFQALDWLKIKNLHSLDNVVKFFKWRLFSNNELWLFEFILGEMLGRRVLEPTCSQDATLCTLILNTHVFALKIKYIQLFSSQCYIKFIGNRTIRRPKMKVLRSETIFLSCTGAPKLMSYINDMELMKNLSNWVNIIYNNSNWRYYPMLSN